MPICNPYTNLHEGLFSLLPIYFSSFQNWLGLIINLMRWWLLLGLLLFRKDGISELPKINKGNTYTKNISVGASFMP